VRIPHRALALAACIAGPGCNGQIGDPGSAAGGGVAIGPGSMRGGASSGTVPAGATVGPNAIRRLGKLELGHTLRDLLPALPATFDPTVDLPADNDVLLAFSLPGTVSEVELQRFMDLAEGAIAALGPNNPGQQLACAAMDEASCARAFVTTFGKRAFRRPLDGVEVDDLIALYHKLRTDPDMAYGFHDALGIVVEAILQSPGFLYRWERGLAAPLIDGTLVKFDSYEMASRLSYFLWRSMPDAALMAAADANRLTTPDEVAAQARRMVDDPRADQTLSDFIVQWLELAPLQGLFKDAATYPAFKPALADSMRAETVAFSRDVLRSSSPTFSNLLTARYTYVDSGLATYYGVTPDGSGRVDLTGTPRLGLLTQGAVMAVKGNSYRTSPARRGKFVLNRMLCTNVPPPPPNVVPALPPPDPTKTVRQQLVEHQSNPACSGCHGSMDAIGFAFEHFDGAGNYQDTDRGQAIDASGSVTLDGAGVDFRDATELATALASSRQAHECFARQWLRYAIDRFEQSADADATAHLGSFYETSGLNTRDLIVEITRTLPFSHRAPAQGEVLTP
jgi:Protein of unknown function (DUF1592)/Protein of unknown function (DUF1588)/Protein of unknown function (DUF1595)/Protein of unknown function (DUF1585)